MDHPEPISKRPPEIPHCRKGFTLDEAKLFVNKIMAVFRSLDDLYDLRSVYETGKQLSRSYFDCHSLRTDLAQALIVQDYPAFASKMMKKLNNMGVFKNDDIWFSSFYFYNTTWNFSEISPEFATALGLAGLPSLLNLNIGHQPYLDNLISRNVHYLIKASLSIIYNIARVPGNVHYFTSDSVKEGLVHLVQREEGFLRCVSVLCLAHVMHETELNLVTNLALNGVTSPMTNAVIAPPPPTTTTTTTTTNTTTTTTGTNPDHITSNNGNSVENEFDLLHLLFDYIHVARVSDKRRCHGIQVLDLLAALAAVSVHDPIKSNLITIHWGSHVDHTDSNANANGHTELHVTNYLNLLKEFIELSFVPNPTLGSVKEARESVRILWHLVSRFTSNSTNSVLQTARQQLTTWLTDMMVNNSSINWTVLGNGMQRALGCINWQLNFKQQQQQANQKNQSKPKAEIRQILLSFAPSNHVNVVRIAERLKSENLPLTNYSCANAHVPNDEATAVGMSMLAANHTSHKKWLDCIEQASVLVVFMSDSFRLSPGCRLEVEHFMASHQEGYIRPVIPVVLQPKFKPTGWLTRLTSRGPIDFNGKRDPEMSYEVLISLLKTSLSEIEVQADQLLMAATISNTGSGVQSRPSLSHELEMNPNSTNDQMHLVDGGSRNVSVNVTPNFKRRPTLTHYDSQTCDATNPSNTTNLFHYRPMVTSAWRYAIRPEIRNWSTSTVTYWLNYHRLGHFPMHGIDGIILSQLAGLRLSAPEYFNQCLRTEFNLSFTDSLIFLEALDKLAPGAEAENQPYDSTAGKDKDCSDGRTHVGSKA